MSETQTTIAELEIPDLLANLVERSLVVCDPITGRHHMTESMRAYAMEHLSEDDSAARRRHFEYYVELGDQLFELNNKGEEMLAFELFVRDEDNFRNAFEWSAANDVNGCLHLMASVLMPWHMRSATESLINSERSLHSAPNGSHVDKVWLRVNMAYVCMRRRQSSPIKEWLDDSLRDLETLDIPAAKANALLTKAWWCRENEPGPVILELTAQAMDIARENNLTRMQALAYTNFGEFARERGDYDEAIRCYLAAMEMCGSSLRTAMNLYNLGQVCLLKEDFDGAEKYFHQGMSHIADYGATPMANAIYGGLGCVYLRHGDFRRSGLVMGSSQAWRDARGTTMDYNDRKIFDDHREMGFELGDEEFASAFKAGLRLTFEQVTELVKQ